MVQPAADSYSAVGNDAVLHAEEQEIRIDQIYGGGGKEDTPIANSFVELYNPSDNVVELTGYMVTFADNGTILSADEGEPRTGASADDPRGSVSVVRIGQDAALAVQTVYFDEFDAQREALTAAGAEKYDAFQRLRAGVHRGLGR